MQPSFQLKSLIIRYHEFKNSFRVVGCHCSSSHRVNLVESGIIWASVRIVLFFLKYGVDLLWSMEPKEELKLLKEQLKQNLKPQLNQDLRKNLSTFILLLSTFKLFSNVPNKTGPLPRWNKGFFYNFYFSIF